MPSRQVAQLAQCPLEPQWQGNIDAAIAEARSLAHPRARWVELSDDDLEGLFSTETPIRGIVEGGRRWALIATIGPELGLAVKRRFDESQFLEAVLLDAAGSVAVEATSDIASAACSDMPGGHGDGKGSVRFSPGYCGWDLESQARLFTLLKPEELGIALHSSFLMQPLKSSTGVVVLGDPDLMRVPREHCRSCDAKGCGRRQ